MKRSSIRSAAVAGMMTMTLAAAFAAEPLKIGLILPMTGPFASTGRQIEAGARLYIAQHGDEVAGRKIELLVKDDTGTADLTKREAQELIVNDKVAVLAGFGLTPLALTVAPLSTQAKIPTVVMSAAASNITDRSPYIVRASYSVPQVAMPIADYALKQGMKHMVTLVADYGAGVEEEQAFSDEFKKGGGKVDNLRVPLQNPEFAAFLQKIADLKPDGLFVFLPPPGGAQFMNQFVDRGLDKAGIKLIAEGAVTEDDILDQMGDATLGAITGHHYSAAHDSPENKEFVKAYTQANPGRRPNMMAVAGYDGIHLVYEALKKTKGSSDGTQLLEAMKGTKFESPRGPVSIDPETREMVQNVYIRRVEKRDGHLWNVEIETIPNRKDPTKEKPAK